MIDAGLAGQNLHSDTFQVLEGSDDESAARSLTAGIPATILSRANGVGQQGLEEVVQDGEAEAVIAPPQPWLPRRSARVCRRGRLLSYDLSP
jgi:hypothetical protein